jgi:4-carboxymuconolactone decarboxylase
MADHMEPEQPPDRMPLPAASSLSGDQKRALSEFADVRGYAARGPFIPLLRSPRLLTAVRAMGDYLRFHIPLRPSLRELAILVAARKWSQPFEWNSHYAIALEHGLSAEVADAIGKGRRPNGLSADEQIVYDFCTELLDHGGVGDGTYELARSRFGEAVIVDLVGLVGYYTLLAMMLNVARTPLPADAKHQLPERTG